MIDQKMLQSIAEIESAQASAYLIRLCKHFAHKLSATTYDDHAGHIPFPAGDCDLAAQGNHLRLAVKASDKEALERLKDVVARHLLRFAFREDLAVNWTDVAAGE
jgi:uncharacterized protein